MSLCQMNSFGSRAKFRSEEFTQHCVRYRETLLTPCFCKSVQTDSGTELTTNGRLCCSFRLKAFLLSLKTASSRVSLHYTRYPPGLIWEEVLLTFLLIVSIFKTTILSSSKAINREVCVGTLRIRGGSSQDCVSPSRGDCMEAKVKDYSTKQHGKKGRDVTEYGVCRSPHRPRQKTCVFLSFPSRYIWFSFELD